MKEYNYALQNADTRLRLQSRTQNYGVTSGKNRYSDFVALETLLRFENCSSSHCLLSSWRRFLVFESSHSSFHRTVFFGAPLAFLRGVAMGLCRRCVIFMSSCGRVFLSSTALHTWAGTWCMGTYIVLMWSILFHIYFTSFHSSREIWTQ